MRASRRVDGAPTMRAPRRRRPRLREIHTPVDAGRLDSLAGDVPEAVGFELS